MPSGGAPGFKVPTDLLDRIKNMQGEELLEEFDEQIEEMDRREQLDQKEKKVVKKLRGLDRSALRSQLQSALTDEELETLFILLLKILSGEVG